MLDLLVIAPHPDDAELHAGGLIAAQVRLGAQVGILDATRGEAASNGDPATRQAEADAAARILGVAWRGNLGLPDGALGRDDDGGLAMAAALRQLAPARIVTLSAHAAHPDHRALAGLVRDGVKLAGLSRLAAPLSPNLKSSLTYPETLAHAAAWPRPPGPPRLWFVEAEWPVQPNLLFALTDDDWQRKRAAIRCHASQFTARVGGTATTINRPEFLDWIDARGRAWGHHAGSPYAEALCSDLPPIIHDLRHLG